MLDEISGLVVSAVSQQPCHHSQLPRKEQLLVYEEVAAHGRWSLTAKLTK